MLCGSQPKGNFSLIPKSYKFYGLYVVWACSLTWIEYSASERRRYDMSKSSCGYRLIGVQILTGPLKVKHKR